MDDENCMGVDYCATEKGVFAEDCQPEHQGRDGQGQAAQAGRCNRPGRGGEGQEEGGQEVAGHVIIRGDCLASLPAIASGSVNLVVADPPYNIGIDYGNGKKADLRDDYAEWCQKWIDECYRVLAPGGSIWIVSGQEYGAHIDIAIQKAGFNMRNRITWHETFGVYCHNKFGRCSRPVFYAVKGDGFVFNKEAVTVPSARLEKYNDKRANPSGKIMGDVWEISRVCGTFKERIEGVPTQLPGELVRRIVGVSSNQGQFVLDPFAGSGTIPAVAVSMGRKAVGIEINPEYAEIAERRIAGEL